MSTTTPGPVGYLLAWVVSVLCFASVFIGLSAAGATNVLDAVWLLPMWVAFVGAWSSPFALVGVLLVHLACGRQEDQRVHVAAAALAGLLPSLFFLVCGLALFALICLPVPLATAIGRWSVVPLVNRRRRLEVSRAAPAAS